MQCLTFESLIARLQAVFHLLYSPGYGMSANSLSKAGKSAVKSQFDQSRDSVRMRGYGRSHSSVEVSPEPKRVRFEDDMNCAMEASRSSLFLLTDYGDEEAVSELRLLSNWHD